LWDLPLIFSTTIGPASVFRNLVGSVATMCNRRAALALLCGHAAFERWSDHEIDVRCLESITLCGAALWLRERRSG
jgi:hypothetical protein